MGFRTHYFLRLAARTVFFFTPKNVMPPSSMSPHLNCSLHHSPAASLPAGVSYHSPFSEECAFGTLAFTTPRNCIPGARLCGDVGARGLRRSFFPRPNDGDGRPTSIRAWHSPCLTKCVRLPFNQDIAATAASDQSLLSRNEWLRSISLRHQPLRSSSCHERALFYALLDTSVGKIAVQPT